MQIKIFEINSQDEKGMALLNSFLRSHRIVAVEQEFVSNTIGVSWHFCIRYVGGATQNYSSSENKKEKIDYKEVLSPAIFSRYSLLRTCRKTIAQQDGVPVFAVFLNNELAEIAKLEPLNVKTLESIQGIGKKRAEKYGNQLIAMYQKLKTNEASKPLNS